MNKKIRSEDHFSVLRKIKNKPHSSQREMAKELGFSLGKLNYCLKALQEKGFVKIRNFQKQKNAYIFNVLTPRNRKKLTINFMKRKMNEYEELKSELKKEE